MGTALMLLLKGFWSGILSFFSKILSDWRLLALVVVLVLGGLIAWEIKKEHTLLTNTQNELKAEKENNKILRNNVASLEVTNKSNEMMIKQLTDDKRLALESVQNLTTQLEKTNQSFTIIQQKISEIKTPPTKVTPYISSAIREIQNVRSGASK